jgi:hypothetical protein
VSVRAKKIETIVFLVIEAKIKEKKNNKLWKKRRFKIKEVVMKKKDKFVARVQTHKILVDKLILDHKGETGDKKYLVKWEKAAELSWIHKRNIFSKKIIAKY